MKNDVEHSYIKDPNDNRGDLDDRVTDNVAQHLHKLISKNGQASSSTIPLRPSDLVHLITGSHHYKNISKYHRTTR